MTPEEVELEKIKFEKLKIVYEHASEHHRYFLNWRYYLITGYFVILGSLFIAAYYFFKDSGRIRLLIFMIPLSSSILSFLFLKLEKRVRKLYHECRKVACTIEQEFKLNLHVKQYLSETIPCNHCKDFRSEGIFYSLCIAKDNNVKTFGDLLKYLYGGMTIASFIICVLSLLHFTFHII